jgi:hypothetical protein
VDDEPVPGRKAPEFQRGVLSESEFLRAAQGFLGGDFIEASAGRFVSMDGMRQVRLGDHELRSHESHGHFEAYNYSYFEGGFIVETATVLIVPD